ncbi:MAG: 4-vinyl reductase [Ignavibacteria bacterium]|nr:4-vinyl reductase [Ignavibacteria bacterium]
MFKEERNTSLFQWSDLGDINKGRPNLGFMTDIRVYRLMQYTLRDVLIKRYGVDETNKLIIEAGYNAGVHFCRNLIDVKLPFNEFIAELQKSLRDLNVGILRLEKTDDSKKHFFISVAEDLDCSGLSVSDETVCNYDEGFFSGIMNEYTGKNYIVKEIDCWSTGDRVCRFEFKQAD